ncbi:glycosyltransferase family 4 protein [Leptolyngbya sp. FACHB-671]|uniref:glycosyltransferase family 4 protein n=1 Tax=Leptolyngbya sp. FACHB-671 TaxID=2692812 RepID=UPI0016838481|nr:glycosyltransferase family 4 protein [Leptolyngbya sp. FACHB-671]MBD2067950.1 glycosyltransferase family 4 protein [Leptolyngbya sp. FACHB-671]
MKILQAIYQYQTGGGSLQVVADLATAARCSGHEVTVLAKDADVSEAIAAERFFTGNKLLDGWRLWQRLQRENYAIVHVHDRYCSLLLRLIPQVPASVQTNHIAYRTRRRLTRFADCVVGCSKAMDRHHAGFFRLPPERRALIPNGVYFRSPNLERAEALRQELPASLRSRQICLTVARLSEQKGHAYLLEAIAQLPHSLRESWCFVWAGDGELRETLQLQAKQQGVSQDIVFLGQTSEVSEWLSLADAFVLPSLYEGLPLALMEAMAAGLPCLATDIDGNQELLHQGENGWLCQVRDPKALANALEHLLTDEELRSRLGKQAQADYWSQWTFDRTWQQYEALYQRLASRSRGLGVRGWGLGKISSPTSSP